MCVNDKILSLELPHGAPLLLPLLYPMQIIFVSPFLLVSHACHPNCSTDNVIASSLHDALGTAFKYHHTEHWGPSGLCAQFTVAHSHSLCWLLTVQQSTAKTTSSNLPMAQPLKVSLAWTLSLYLESRCNS